MVEYLSCGILQALNAVEVLCAMHNETAAFSVQKASIAEGKQVMVEAINVIIV